MKSKYNFSLAATISINYGIQISKKKINQTFDNNTRQENILIQ